MAGKAKYIQDKKEEKGRFPPTFDTYLPPLLERRGKIVWLKNLIHQFSYSMLCLTTLVLPACVLACTLASYIASHWMAGMTKSPGIRCLQPDGKCFGLSLLQIKVSQYPVIADILIAIRSRSGNLSCHSFIENLPSGR
mgnify:CR=1 FL=1